MEEEYESCDFCETATITNARISSERMINYSDGAPPAFVPSVVVCTECADDVSDYFRARRGETLKESEGDSALTEEDIEVILDLVKNNNRLVLDPGFGYGIRFIDREWKQAIQPDPSPPTIRALTRSEVVDTIQSVDKVILKSLDELAWLRFEKNPREYAKEVRRRSGPEPKSYSDRNEGTTDNS